MKAHVWFKGFDWKALEQRKMKPPWVPPLASVEDVSNIDPVDQDTPVRRPAPSGRGQFKPRGGQFKPRGG